MWCQSMLHQFEPDDYSWDDRYSTIKRDIDNQQLENPRANIMWV